MTIKRFMAKLHSETQEEEERRRALESECIRVANEEIMERNARLREYASLIADTDNYENMMSAAGMHSQHTLDDVRRIVAELARGRQDIPLKQTPEEKGVWG